MQEPDILGRSVESSNSIGNKYGTDIGGYWGKQIGQTSYLTFRHCIHQGSAPVGCLIYNENKDIASDYNTATTYLCQI